MEFLLQSLVCGGQLCDSGVRRGGCGHVEAWVEATKESETTVKGRERPLGARAEKNRKGSSVVELGVRLGRCKNETDKAGRRGIQTSLTGNGQKHGCLRSRLSCTPCEGTCGEQGEEARRRGEEEEGGGLSSCLSSLSLPPASANGQIAIWVLGNQFLKTKVKVKTIGRPIHIQAFTQEIWRKQEKTVT